MRREREKKCDAENLRKKKETDCQRKEDCCRKKNRSHVHNQLFIVRSKKVTKVEASCWQRVCIYKRERQGDKDGEDCDVQEATEQALQAYRIKVETPSEK